jgi:hypothetical protein
LKKEENYFASYNQRFKNVCNKKTCTGCTSPFYVAKAHRWCYDEKFNLRSDQVERVRVNKITSNVMTGIIEIFDKDSNGETVNDFDLYEKNLKPYSEFITDDRMVKGVQRVAETFGIQANSLTACLIKELK